MKTDLKTKLSSRKLWAAIAAFVATVLVAIFKEDIPPDAVSLIKNGVIALWVYIFGEAGVDIARMIWQDSGAGTGGNTSGTAELPPTTIPGTGTGEPEPIHATITGKATPKEAETHSDTTGEDEPEEDEPPGAGT